MKSNTKKHSSLNKKSKRRRRRQGGCGCSSNLSKLFLNGGNGYSLEPTNYNNNVPNIPLNSYTNTPQQFASRLDPQLSITPFSMNGGKRRGKTNKRKLIRRKNKSKKYKGGDIGNTFNALYNNTLFSNNPNIISTFGDIYGIPTNMGIITQTPITSNIPPVVLNTIKNPLV